MLDPWHPSHGKLPGVGNLLVCLTSPSPWAYTHAHARDGRKAGVHRAHYCRARNSLPLCGGLAPRAWDALQVKVHDAASPTRKAVQAKVVHRDPELDLVLLKVSPLLAAGAAATPADARCLLVHVTSLITGVCSQASWLGTVAVG